MRTLSIHPDIFRGSHRALEVDPTSVSQAFDDLFFVYYEEVDFSFRAYKLGYSSYLLTEATAFHKGGGCTDAVKATRLFYSLRSRLQYGRKHFSAVTNLALMIIT